MDHHLHKNYFFIKLNEFFADEKISLKKARVQPKTNLWFHFNIVRNLPSNILISKPVDSDVFIYVCMTAAEFKREEHIEKQNIHWEQGIP